MKGFIIITAFIFIIALQVHYILKNSSFDLHPAVDDPSGAVMKAIVYEERGNAEVLTLVDDFPRPFPLPHQV